MTPPMLSLPAPAPRPLLPAGPVRVRPPLPAVIYLPAHAAQLTQMTVSHWLAGPSGACMIGPGGLVYLDVA